MSLSERLADKLNRPKDTAPHLIVQARAGTGKTTTLVEGLKILKFGGSAFRPSPQQKAIWNAICLSPSDSSVCFVAFNKSIATELQQRVPTDCDAMTMHSMGFKAVQNHFGRAQLNNYRVRDLIAETLGMHPHDLRRTKPELLKATERLVSLCKMNLIDLSADAYIDYELSDLAAQYDVDLNGDSREVFDLVPKVLERCKDVEKDGYIDFDDMIWLPIVLDLAVTRYNLLLVDECQDLNRCQQQLALKAGHRLILCGDDRQAIYGFAGADSESMARMEKLLSTQGSFEKDDPDGSLAAKGWDNRVWRDQGCQLLPLTVTRRCGKAIVREAQKIVPDFEAHPSRGEGRVSYAQMKDALLPTQGIEGAQFGYITMVEDGDMVLCRCNAPLVSECFRFLRMGRKANIQGRDVGQGLISTIKKLRKKPLCEGPEIEVRELVAKLSHWLCNETSKENAKRNPSEARLIALQDRHDCLYTFCEDAATVEEVIQRIERIFTDDKDNKGIRLSSIHKAKGLESERVFLLQPEGATVPHPLAKTPQAREQELNCLYIAITRARKELIYVS